MATFAVQIIYRGYVDNPRLAPIRYEFVILAAPDEQNAREIAAGLARERESEDVVELVYGPGSLEFLGIGSVRTVNLSSPEFPVLVGWVDDAPVNWRYGLSNAANC